MEQEELSFNNIMKENERESVMILNILISS